MFGGISFCAAPFWVPGKFGEQISFSIATQLVSNESRNSSTPRPPRLAVTRNLRRSHLQNQTWPKRGAQKMISMSDFWFIYCQTLYTLYTLYVSQFLGDPLDGPPTAIETVSSTELGCSKTLGQKAERENNEPNRAFYHRSNHSSS